jgi:hypothetical protein
LEAGWLAGIEQEIRMISQGRSVEVIAMVLIIVALGLLLVTCAGQAPRPATLRSLPAPASDPVAGGSGPERCCQPLETPRFNTDPAPSPQALAPAADGSVASGGGLAPTPASSAGAPASTTLDGVIGHDPRIIIIPQGSIIRGGTGVHPGTGAAIGTGAATGTGGAPAAAGPSGAGGAPGTGGTTAPPPEHTPGDSSPGRPAVSVPEPPLAPLFAGGLIVLLLLRRRKASHQPLRACKAMRRPDPLKQVIRTP